MRDDMEQVITDYSSCNFVFAFTTVVIAFSGWFYKSSYSIAMLTAREKERQRKDEEEKGK